MSKQRIRLTVAAVLLPALMLLLSGCWDNHELDTLFIVTGVALDKADDPEQLDIALQIGKTRSNTSDSGEPNSQEDSTILLKTTGNTMLEGLMKFNRDSSRTLLLQHNQVLLLGSALAEQGVKDHIDLFLRDQEARMEVLVMVAEGRAEEVLSARLEQEKISGIYLARVMQDLYAVSPYYKIRMLDFVSRLRDGTSSPVAPVAVLTGKGDKQEIWIDGLAVFKGDKLIGRLSNDEALGYVWTMGDVAQCGVVAQSKYGRAVFRIVKLDAKRDITLRPDGSVLVTLSVDATLGIGELRGFDGISPKALMPYLVELAQDQIREQIMDTFQTAQALNADIYGFGTSVHRAYPGEWKAMKGRWGKLFPEIGLDVQCKVHLPATGQIVKSLEMEGSKK
ncbi:MAG TPA: Ger(x)C family spore germination protein [Syntrophomonas sp.]|nr:Ger(x)C family spore germination protein [Syntrophomonas sp.]